MTALKVAITIVIMLLPIILLDYRNEIKALLRGFKH